MLNLHDLTFMVNDGFQEARKQSWQQWHQDKCAERTVNVCPMF